MPTEAENKQQALNDLISKFPKRYRVKATTYLKALLEAFAEGDGYIATTVEAVRDNLVAVNASGVWLDRAASRYGIVRGQGTGVFDGDFRNLVPVLGMSPKQISNILLKVIDTIYGPFSSHANVTSSLEEPYNITAGMTLIIRVDDQVLTVIFTAEDAVDLSNATSAELSTAISKKTRGKIVGESIFEARSGKRFINVRTDTIGSQGFIQVIGGSAQTKLRFPEIRDLAPSSSTWNISRYSGSDEMVYEVVGGTLPDWAAAGIIRGDFCTIREDSGFSLKNTGTFVVTFVGSTYIRLRNPEGIPESGITQNNVDDFVFYKPDLSNILLINRPAALIETAPQELTIILPVTSPIVKRDLKGGLHFHQGLTTALSATSNSLTVANINGFLQNGNVQPVLSRKNSKGTVSSVGASTVNLISGNGWATKGAFWSPSLRQFYYYSGKTGNQLTGVLPSPSASLVGSSIKYTERYYYGTITSFTLNTVYPNPTSLVDHEIVAAGANVSLNFPSAYLYDPEAPFIITEKVTFITETVRQGSVKTVLRVDNVTSFPDKGFLVLEHGSSSQEGPIKFFAKTGVSSLIIDPSHVFERDHLSGVNLRLISQIGPYLPRIDGQDLAVYSTSTSPARDLLAKYLRQIAASGVRLKFLIKIPEQKWLVLPNLFTSDPLETELV